MGRAGVEPSGWAKQETQICGDGPAFGNDYADALIFADTSHARLQHDARLNALRTIINEPAPEGSQ